MNNETDECSGLPGPTGCPVALSLRSRLASLEKELEEARVQANEHHEWFERITAEHEAVIDRATKAEARVAELEKEINERHNPALEAAEARAEEAERTRDHYWLVVQMCREQGVTVMEIGPLDTGVRNARADTAEAALTQAREELKVAQAARLEACEGESARAVERDAALAAVAELRAVLEWWVRTHDHNNTKPPVCVGLVGPPEPAGEAAERLSASRKALASTTLGKGRA